MLGCRLDHYSKATAVRHTYRDHSIWQLYLQDAGMHTEMSALGMVSCRQGSLVRELSQTSPFLQSAVAVHIVAD